MRQRGGERAVINSSSLSNIAIKGESRRVQEAGTQAMTHVWRCPSRKLCQTPLPRRTLPNRPTPEVSNLKPDPFPYTIMQHLLVWVALYLFTFIYCAVVHLSCSTELLILFGEKKGRMIIDFIVAHHRAFA